MALVPRRRLGALGAAAALAAVALPAAPAHAVHLFPLTPAFDPLGHDCAKKLTAPSAVTDAGVFVVGFSFIDARSLTSQTTISRGQTLTWSWLLDHCHSVTFSSGFGTAGTAGFQPAQPELVRNGTGNAFSVKFTEPGVFSYLCVHHAGVGMTGTVTVT